MNEQNETTKRQAQIGKRWEEDSSLEAWFPFTAEKLTKLQQHNKELITLVQELKSQIEEHNRVTAFVPTDDRNKKPQ